MTAPKAGCKLTAMFFHALGAVFLSLTLQAAAQSTLPACPSTGVRHNCHGEITLTNGGRYLGEFREGKRHGRGLDLFPNGDRYEGEYRDGNRHGTGTYTHASGDRYVGEYREGKRHGTGSFFFVNGDRYTGDYREGVRNGQGTYVHASGDRYLGEFRDDRRSGLGVFIYGPGAAEGVRYVGHWRDGKANGQGIEYQPDGTIRRSGLWTDGTLTTATALETARFPFAGFTSAASTATAPGSDAARAERDRLTAEAESERRRRQQLEAQLEVEKKRREEAEARNRGGSRPRSTGTGFAVAPSFLITNQHVVAGCQRLDVISPDGRRVARVIDTDETVDLALLRVTGLTGPVAPLRRAGSIRLGESAYAFGFPLAGLLSEQGNFTNGVVSSLRGMRDSANQLQITTPVQPGNSGGAVVDASGGVIGVVVAKLNAAAVAQATGDIPQNVNFAISLQALTDFLRKNNVSFSTVERGISIDTVQLADTLRGFTHRIECAGPPESSAQVAPAPPARREPAPSPTATRDTTVMVWNQSQEPVYRLFVSPSNSNSWGTDWLGKSVLYMGESFRVEPPASQGCNFDVRVEYKSGRHEEKRDQDFCALTDLNFAGAAAAPAGAAAAPSWVLVSRNVSDTEVYVDPATIRREGRLRRYWDLTNYPSARSNGALSGRYLMEIDCQEQRSRILQSATFTGAMLGGTLISRSNNPGSWDYVAPRTQGAEVMRYVCER